RAELKLMTEGSSLRAIVLAPNPAGTGGIERATRTLIRCLSDLYGPERVGLLAVWKQSGISRLPCRVLYEGRSMNRTKQRVGWTQQATYLVRALRETRRLGRQGTTIATHPALAGV